ncbi:MAG: hypothetical protein Q6373_011245 [Candidatus Sigynarchaeota archaeon]
MIRKKIWDLSIGHVELFDDKLTVRADTDYKGLDKKYKETASLSDESKMVLMNVFEKKKTRVYAFKPERRAELDAYFSKIGEKEGVQGEYVEEREREPERTSPSGSKAGAPGGKISAMIEEIINHEISHDGEVKSAKGAGSISIVNKADKQSVWDIDINVDGGDDTTLEGRQFHVNELRAGEEWKREYGMAFKDGTKPPVQLVEEINTAPGGTQPSLVFVLDAEEKGQDTSFKLNVQNSGQKIATGLKVSKQVTDVFREVTIGTASRGSAKRDAGEVVWDVGDLNPGETATLELKARAFPKDITAYSSGEIDVEYEIASDTRVSLKADKILLGGSTAFSLDLDERDTEPDVWDGIVTIENRSEFPMHLGEILLKFETTGGKITPVSLDANTDIDPGSAWTSEKFTIESADEPGFKDNVVAIFKDVAVGFTVTPDIVQKTIYSTWIEPLDLHVLALEGTKTFDAYAVKSYRDNLLHAVIDVKTRGAAPVASMHLEDTIPRDFANPDAKEIEVFIAGQKVDPTLYTVAYSGDDIATERKMTIDVKEIKDRFGEIEDNTSIQVKYPVMVHHPKRDATYKTESLFQAYLTLPGPPIECKMETSQSVVVVHQRRKTTVGKSIVPGMAKGEYDIVLIYKNKADFNKTGVKVSDFVPKEFAVMAQKPECETTKRADGTMLIWTFDVEAGKEVELSYKVQGKSDEASLKDIEAKAFK